MSVDEDEGRIVSETSQVGRASTHGVNGNSTTRKCLNGALRSPAGEVLWDFLQELLNCARTRFVNLRSGVDLNGRRRVGDVANMRPRNDDFTQGVGCVFSALVFPILFVPFRVLAGTWVFAFRRVTFFGLSGVGNPKGVLVSDLHTLCGGR